MKDQYPSSTGKQLAITFVVSLVLNSIVIWIASSLFPEQIVLGNVNSSMGWATFHSMVMLSLIGTLSVPLFEWKQVMKGKALTTMDWMLGYFVLDFVGLWVISRFSEQFGLGIAAWWITLILAIILDFVQGLGMMAVYPKSK